MQAAQTKGKSVVKYTIGHQRNDPELKPDEIELSPANLASAPRRLPVDVANKSLRTWKSEQSKFDAETAARAAELETKRQAAIAIQNQHESNLAHRDGLKNEIANIETTIVSNDGQLREWRQHFKANFSDGRLHELQSAATRLEWMQPLLRELLQEKRLEYGKAIKTAEDFAATNDIALT
jgi:hypothetical protein